MEEQQQLQQELSGKIESINLFEVQTEVLGFNPVNFVDEFINSSSIEIYKLADELQYWMERSILPHIKNNNNDDDNERNIEQQGSDHGNEETNQAEDDNAIKDSSLDENDRSKKRKISSFSNKSRDDNQASSRKSHTLTKEDKLHAATQKWLTKLEKRMDKAFDRWEIYILRNLGKTKTPYIWPTDQVKCIITNLIKFLLIRNGITYIFSFCFFTPLLLRTRQERYLMKKRRSWI